MRSRYIKTQYASPKDERIIYGIKIRVDGRYIDVMEDGKPLIYMDKKQRNDKIKEMEE